MILSPILSTGSYEETNSGYKALADQEGFVVAFPYGIDNAWNVGPCCTTSRTVDDLAFAKGMVDEMIRAPQRSESQGLVGLKPRSRARNNGIE